MKKKPSKRSSEDYEELGRRLENIYLTGYVSKIEMLKMSFLKGLITGFAGVIGATLMVGLLLWTLSLFDSVRFIGPLITDLQQSINNR